MSKFVAFLKDESGASAAEYVLILAIIGSGVALAAGALGVQIERVLTETVTAVTGVSVS
ncbi:Flp family type IVb pilin [Phenylobacterium sp.]|uniref:Flp family type IVb pilin n=1 Tax=Phenylobacterium sp. TaxID=1871053 RepID=UPI0028A1A127|nr:Flp family type IVb pilin [Phenylobacterium sp.]